MEKKKKEKKKKERGVFGWYVTFLYIQFKKIGGFKSRYFCLKFKKKKIKFHCRQDAYQRNCRKWASSTIDNHAH